MRELAECRERAEQRVRACVALQESGLLCASRGKVRSLKLTERALELIEALAATEADRIIPWKY